MQQIALKHNLLRARIIINEGNGFMKRFSGKLGIYMPLILIATVLAVGFRTAASLSDFDFGIGEVGLIYYKSGALIGIANWITIAAALLSVSFVFVGGKFNPRVTFDSAASFVPSGAVSVALIFISAELLHSIKTGSGRLLSRAALTPANILTAVLAVLAISSALNFFFNAFYPKNKSTTRAAFAILATLFLAGYASFLYFDPSLPKNAPSRIVDEMAYLFTAVFFLYEARISLGRKMMKAYTGFGLAAMLLTAYSSIPSLIVYFSKGALLSHSLSESILSFSLFCYIFIKLGLLLFSPEDKINPVTEAVAKMAKMRKEQIEEERELSHARDINIKEENESEEDECEELPTQQALDFSDATLKEREDG